MPIKFTNVSEEVNEEPLPEAYISENGVLRIFPGSTSYPGIAIDKCGSIYSADLPRSEYRKWSDNRRVEIVEIRYRVVR